MSDKYEYKSWKLIEVNFSIPTLEFHHLLPLLVQERERERLYDPLHGNYMLISLKYSHTHPPFKKLFLIFCTLAIMALHKFPVDCYPM